MSTRPNQKNYRNGKRLYKVTNGTVSARAIYMISSLSKFVLIIICVLSLDTYAQICLNFFSNSIQIGSHIQTFYEDMLMEGEIIHIDGNYADVATPSGLIFTALISELNPTNKITDSINSINLNSYETQINEFTYLSFDKNLSEKQLRKYLLKFHSRAQLKIIKLHFYLKTNASFQFYIRSRTQAPMVGKIIKLVLVSQKELIVRVEIENHKTIDLFLSQIILKKDPI